MNAGSQAKRLRFSSSGFSEHGSKRGRLKIKRVIDCDILLKIKTIYIFNV